MMIWRSGNIKSRLMELKKATEPRGNPFPYSKYNFWLSVLPIQRLIKNTELGRLVQSGKTRASHKVKNEPVRRALAMSKCSSTGNNQVADILFSPIGLFLGRPCVGSPLGALARMGHSEDII